MSGEIKNPIKLKNSFLPHHLGWRENLLYSFTNQEDQIQDIDFPGIPESMSFPI